MNMLLVIKMRSVSNVCGVAYMADKEPYTDCLGRVTWYTSSLLIIFSAVGPSEAESSAAAGAPVESEV